MSVFGVDLGNLNSTVGITRNGGIDIVLNEVSKRETSSIVSLTEGERFIGESGLDRYVRNAKNTVACVKRFIGMRMGDANWEREKRFLTCPTAFDVEGRLQFELTYGENTISFYPEQILAMLLQQLRSFVNRECTTDPKFPADVKDCVITVPCYYTPEQRRLVIQACEMAGINAMSLLNETTAASIDYGIFRGSSLPEKESDAQVVVILDVGYGTTTVAVTAFWRGNLTVLSRNCDRFLGTREVDWVLYEHMVEEVKKKYKVDVRENARARLRLLQGCEKVKYLLSGNQSAPLNIENLMDIDVAISSYTRSDLESACQELVDRLKALITNTLAESGIERTAVHSCEFIGGGCRIPMFKRAVEEVFERPASFTLNASESVARGAAITAAMFSPKFHVREYIVRERPARGVQLGYHLEGTANPQVVPSLPEVNRVAPLLSVKEHYPTTREVTAKVREPFSLVAFLEATKTEAPTVIGRWEIGRSATAAAEDRREPSEVRIRVRVLPSGLLSLESANAMESYECEETEERKNPEKPDAEPEKVTVKKTKTRRVELTVRPVTAGVQMGHSAETVLACAKLEEEMHRKDLILMRTKDSKNALESYLLDFRGRLSPGGPLAAFVTKEQQAQFMKLAEEYETWLYDEGSDSTAEEYESRTKCLQEIGQPALRRWRASEDLPFAHKGFAAKAQAIRDMASAAVGKHAHIATEELHEAMGHVDEFTAWANKELEKYLAAPKTSDPTYSATTLETKLKEVEAKVKAVVNKKPPKAEPTAKAEDATPPPPPPAADPNASAEAPQTE